MQFEFNLDKIHLAAQFVIKNADHKVVLFRGEMGAGKTTLIKEIAKILGVKGATSSPTFSMVNEYKINDHEILYHFDLYRLKSDVEALDFGIDDYLYSGDWCFLEWPDKVENLLPTHVTAVSLELLENNNRLLAIS